MSYKELDSKYLLERYGQKDHVRLYGRDFLERWDEMGCKGELVRPESFLSPEDIQIFLIDIYDYLYLCRKVTH